MIGASAGTVVLALAGCRARQSSAQAASRSSAETSAPYQHEPWRVLSWAERDAITLWVSQIVVSHRDAHGDPHLRPGGWHPDALSKRSREEAQALALRLAADAEAHPDTFEELARKNSDDEVTRSTGGSLGGVRASELPSSFLDALTALRPGDVSKVIETGLGFHVLLRRMPPPHEDVEGQRVVIRYAGTHGSLDASPSERSREEAKALADTIVNQARDGTSFESLVRQYSEHADRVFGGDMGVWSTLAPGSMSREVETLSRLNVGEVSAPVDTHWGFQVLQRIEARPHERYAMAAVRLKYGPTVPAQDPGSRPSVRAQAQELAQRLRKAPSSFVDVQREHGEAKPEVWDWGHGQPQVELALDPLHFGEVAAEPIETPFFFVIPMRLDPALVEGATEPTHYDLPTHTTPDLEGLFRDVKGAELSRRIAGFLTPEVASALRLNDREQNALRSTLGTLNKDLKTADNPDARAKSYRSAVKELYGTLPEACYARVMDFFEREAARMVIAEPR